MNLREYQIGMKNAAYGALSDHDSALLVSATGSGKGFLIGHIGAQIVEKDRRLLIVTNRRIIVHQLKDHAESHGSDVGIIMADQEPNPEAPIQVASIATLKRRKWYGLQPTDWLIVDEAHREPESYKTLFSELRKLNPRTKLLGLTATPLGPGGTRLDGYDVLVEPVRNSWLIDNEWLLPTKVFSVSSPDMTGVDISKVDEVNQRTEECTVMSDVWKMWLPYSDQQTICFVPRVAFAHGIAEQFEAKGFKAKVIDASTRQQDRADIFAEFKEEDARVLVAVDVLREGFDAPNARVLIDIQPTQQFRVHWQKVGRIRRIHPGQKHAVLLDFAANTWKDNWPHPDEDPGWDELTDGKTAEDLFAERAGLRCPKCGSRDIHDGRCENCGHEVKKRMPKWTCPICRQQLSPWQSLKSGNCPNCGAPLKKPTRRIRFKDGSMREVTVEEIKKRRKKKYSQPQQQTWDKWRYIAENKDKSLGWAAMMMKKVNGSWPDSNLKCVPEKGSIDWKRKPSQVYHWMKKK